MVKICIINTENGSQNNQDIATKYIDKFKFYSSKSLISNINQGEFYCDTL